MLSLSLRVEIKIKMLTSLTVLAHLHFFKIIVVMEVLDIFPKNTYKMEFWNELHQL